jgi:WD40 repeat protein
MNQSRFLRSISRLGIPSALLLMTGNCTWGFGSKDVAVKVAELPERYHDVTVQGVAFSGDGKTVAVDSFDQKINIWNWRKNHIEKTIIQPEGFNSGWVADTLRYSPDGRLFAACGGRGPDDVIARVWQADSWEIARDVVDAGAGSASGMTFSPNGQLLMYAMDRHIKFGDTLMVQAINTWQPEWSIKMPEFHPYSMAISPDGKLLAIGGSILTMPADVVDKIEAAQQIKYVPTICIVDMEQHKVVQVLHGDAVGSLDWSPDGARIAIGGNSYVEIFSTQSGERLVHDRFEGSTHVSVRFTPDGRYLLESDMNGRGTGLGARIWDGQHSKLLQAIRGNIASIAVSRDSKYFALGGQGGTTIWQFKAAELPQ